MIEVSSCIGSICVYCPQKGSELVRGSVFRDPPPACLSFPPHIRWGTTSSRLLLFGRRWLICATPRHHGHRQTLSCHHLLLLRLLPLIAPALWFPLLCFFLAFHSVVLCWSSWAQTCGDTCSWGNSLRSSLLLQFFSFLSSRRDSGCFHNYDFTKTLQ